VTTTAVTSAKSAVVDSVEVDGSAVYSRYNNGPRTLPWGCTYRQRLMGEIYELRH
jgi:hypothetical protein